MCAPSLKISMLQLTYNGMFSCKGRFGSSIFCISKVGKRKVGKNRRDSHIDSICGNVVRVLPV